jgi:hypothetical protein
VEKATKAKETQPDLPAYDITKEEDCSGDFPTKCYSVSTDATSEEALTLLTENFRDENPEYEAVLVTYYPNEPQASPSGSGYAFRSEEAARAILSQMTQSSATGSATASAKASVDEEVRQTMENGGIWVLAIEEEVESMTQEMCAEWDTTTMGAPPKEWNCPGY